MRSSSSFLLAVFLVLLASRSGADTQQKLAAYRQEIDSIDAQIVRLIEERARVVKEVGEAKREANLPVKVQSREGEVIQKARDLAKPGPLPADAVGRIYEKVVQEMRDWEERTVAAKTKAQE